MRFRHLIEEISLNGTRDVLTNDYEKSELILGRGSACDIKFESTFVSLKHAKLSLSDGALRIEDLGSLSGTQVNNKIVRDLILRDGDEIRLGDVLLTVYREGDLWGVKETRKEREAEGGDAAIEKDLERVDIYKTLPRMRFISAILLLTVAGCYLVMPLVSGKQGSWSSGPISSGHSMIAENCSACHGEPFSRVPDAKCSSCHNMSEHADAFKHHKIEQVRCAECHLEHNGDMGLVEKDSRLCIDCHADIKRSFSESKIADIPGISNHPEFTVNVQPSTPGGEYTRVRLDDRERLRDRSNVKLNHKIHLEPLRSKTETVTLDCRDCHNPSKDLKKIEPINFETHCDSCHSLEFDDRLAGKEVPHGDPDVVYKYLFAEYAKLLLSANESPQKQQNFVQRFKPGGSLPSMAEPDRQDDFKRAFVEKESRAAERTLFTKTACYLCHLVSEKPVSENSANNDSSSKFEILKPDIPTQWMPSAVFSHGAHEAVRCDDCHEGVRESTKTNQVLLPKIKKCQMCHTDHNAIGLVKSDCVMCHSYHDQRLIAPEVKRLAEEILGKK